MTKKILISVIVIILAAGILNMPVPTRQGVDYKVTIHKIPLYIKIVEFIDRDYRYKALSRQIIKGRTGDKDKALAILEWVRQNIKTDIPAGWPVYDDHILGIITRGYGESDQLSDVFTLLCMYAGLSAWWGKIDLPGRGSLILSFVKIDGEWRAFDAYREIYFINDDGDIASREDILANRYRANRVSDFRYEDYLPLIGRCRESIEWRARMQMPFYRIIYELRKNDLAGR